MLSVGELDALNRLYHRQRVFDGYAKAAAEQGTPEALTQTLQGLQQMGVPPDEIAYVQRRFVDYVGVSGPPCVASCLNAD